MGVFRNRRMVVKTWLKEFKAFAIRGNVMEIAVAVIIGGAFGKIVTSFVGDLVMPLVGLISGGINLSGLVFTLGDASIRYGAFLQAVVDFFVVALVVFLLVKAVNRVFPKPQGEVPAVLATKECPYCFMTIPSKATRCPHCTSALE